MEDLQGKLKAHFVNLLRRNIKMVINETLEKKVHIFKCTSCGKLILLGEEEQVSTGHQCDYNLKGKIEYVAEYNSLGSTLYFELIDLKDKITNEWLTTNEH